MGDNNRFTVVADFISRNFPVGRFPRVADVAGGQGYLSLLLVERGYEPTLIDPRQTDLPRALRIQQRRNRRLLFNRERREYRITDAKRYDLIVGLHPDEATEAITRSADERPVVVLPCCDFWKGVESHQYRRLENRIVAVWQNLGVFHAHTLLPFGGKNEVLWTPTTKQ